MSSLDSSETVAPEVQSAPDVELDLAALYERHKKQVFALALRYGRGNVSWAEDVMHDVFLELARSPRALLDREALFGWFYRVTTNRCLNRLRHEALLNSAPVRWLLGERTPPPTPEATLLARSELEQALVAVDTLPVKERVVFCMCHLDGLTQNQAARVLGHSKGYVSKLLKRAEARLAAQGWEVRRGT